MESRADYCFKTSTRLATVTTSDSDISDRAPENDAKIINLSLLLHFFHISGWGNLEVIIIRL